MFAIWSYHALFVCVLALTGCVSQHSFSPTGVLDFSWKLSGDKSVAPVQVFSDATHTWLQWQPNQTLPAIFGVTAQGEQLASYERQGLYTKLETKWVGFVFRGAHRQAKARRSSERSLPRVSSIESLPVSSAAQSSSLETASEKKPGLQVFYAIHPSDKNLRQALSRWAVLSGWRFQVEHWAVDVDIPLTATANFSDDFVGSVRALIEATELSDRPLQPCFYTNQVLRVVPIAELCDRTATESTKV